MVDFIEAFKEGQTAAEIAKRNNFEIDSVFEELNEQLNKATNGKIEIFIRVGYRDLSFETDKFEESRYEIISARACSNFSSIQDLVKWHRGRQGYPCKITIGNKQHYCEDKMELENTLALMLQDPIVAETLTNLMQLSENQAIACHS
jgi:hypothetical protein